MTIEQIVEIWKNEIESINIRGYSRKISLSQSSFYPTTNPHKRGSLNNLKHDFYRIDFIFEDVKTINPCNEIYLNQKERDDWKKELESHFIKKFKSHYTGSFSPEQVIRRNKDFILFNNEYCDFFGWETGVMERESLIIQFYLSSVVSKIREEKLKELID